jgi:hypothetical protein
VAAEGQQARLVTLDQGLESGLIALTGERNEPFVALEPKQGRAPAKCGNYGTVL